MLYTTDEIMEQVNRLASMIASLDGDGRALLAQAVGRERDVSEDLALACRQEGSETSYDREMKIRACQAAIYDLVRYTLEQ